MKENGQALIILAISFLLLLAIVGLVTDAGSVYITYTQLKRAVDSAAIAAANNIKSPQMSASLRKQQITESAREMLAFHNITDLNSLAVFLCTDANLPTEFANFCPASGDPPRKLAWVEASQNSPVYFLSIFGIPSIPIKTSAVGEAATVDLVLVFDTSESMASDTCTATPLGDTDPPCTPNYDPNDFNPQTCNSGNNCYPLREAKDAAKNLVRNLFEGYDQIGIVTFDYSARLVFALNSVYGDDDGASDGDLYDAIDTLVNVHDDAPSALLAWYPPQPWFDPPLNPIFPDDRDGDGRDEDPGAPCVDADWNLWDDDSEALGQPQPCDDDFSLDAYDWNRNGLHDDDDGVKTIREQMSLLSTCTGCGIRVAKNVLVAGGRPNSIWVVIFLSDGIANLSDTNATYSAIPVGFEYGFCGDNPNTSFWPTFCIDRNTGANAGRHCIDSVTSQCPPGTTHTNASGPYSVEDYAFDMADEAALLFSTNAQEPVGEDIIIYAVGLDAARSGADILRYMASVGDDGSRASDPCAGVHPTWNCGNYYYAPTGAYLDQIFENIAARIFTKISR